ncbi:MAG: hypothetical protein JO029_02625 [Candidatus Eremiobacteraeota bacterium]|nr:hypothetical protein [Candidatus Eremiobacteraeota bacterium]MBV8283391.1 hypothetical protein [Candidatus Eremiobacteraeota bacterium]MBV8332183.1 hypothetical protein [Candidatus Eremiobacteraeota bacterium]MBV8433155.1 hypothetical protein [Candidatus Eremiobacteraeota bacterium]MBV8655724.1 hypothetical protein [Candidatus Eremiobacteraeota bacterium]
MRDRSFSEPSEYVIWTTSSLLALLVGTAAAFFLWLALHGVTQTGLASASVGALGAGTVLIALSVDKPLLRVFLVVLAAVLVLGYTLGGPEFARLAA